MTARPHHRCMRTVSRRSCSQCGVNDAATAPARVPRFSDSAASERKPRRARRHRRRGCRSVVANAAVFSWTPQRSIRDHSSLADVATLMSTPQRRSRRRTSPNDAAAFPTTREGKTLENLALTYKFMARYQIQVMLYLILQPRLSKVFRLFGALAAGLRSTARSRPPT